LETRHRELILELPNLLLRADQENRPLELQPLDIRGKLRHTAVKVLNSQGQPVICHFEYSIAGDLTRSYNLDSELTLTSVSDVEMIIVRSYGYATETITPVMSKQTVTLKDAFKVTFQIPEQFINYRGFNVRLTEQGDSNIPMPENRAFDSSGELTMFIPIAGEYRFGLCLGTGTSEFSPGINLSQASYSIQKAGQRISIPVDQKAMDRAADRLLQGDD
tara:strand:+ start:323 stop:979 length:657 start_codon:yes stop_codon:yes gene_type:complete